MLIDEAYGIVLQRGWLSLTPEHFRWAVLDRCLLEHFRAGATIFMRGEPPSGMFGLVAGRLSISMAPGRPYLAHFARPGTWFGETAAFTGRPQRLSLTATRDTELLRLTLPAIQEIVSHDPAAWRLFALVTIGHMNLAVGASDDLMIRDHVKRFIAVLLRLGACRWNTSSDSVPIELDIKQQDLASMANVSRTTAGAILRKLEASGHLDVSYSRIRILAPDALRAMLAD